MRTEDRIFIKDDINFLENPNWVVSKRDFPTHLIITKDNGYYEMKSPEGMPVRFDKIVFYYLLHKVVEQTKLESTEIVTTRYEIAKNVFNQEKNYSKTKYDRIMLSLKKWKAIFIKFEGVFTEGDNNTIKYFSILDFVSLDKKTKKLFIKFNDQYIQQLRDTKFYQYINLTEYKKLTRPVSTRLYELLMKNLFTQALWNIDINELATMLTIGKRSYPSQIIASLRPAIVEINKKTTLNIKFKYNKKSNSCMFKKVAEKTKTPPSHPLDDRIYTT